MATTVAILEAKLRADTGDFDKRMGQSESKMQKASRGIQKGALVAGTAIAGGLAVAAKIGFDEFVEGQRVAAQTEAVLKSTGGVANVTAEEVSNLSEALMKKSGVDDEAIATGANMLLTFKQIRNEAGAGNDIFNQATSAVLDLSVAMGQDTQQSAVMLGKALNDPIRGLTAMRRVGIQFTAAQEEQIKAMVESGDVMGAQKVILAELESQFGGSAEAAGKTFGGQINILRESFSNFAGEIVGRIIPHLLSLAGFFQRHSTLAKVLAGVVGVLTAALLTAGAALFLYNSALGKGVVRLIRYIFVTRTATGVTRAQAAAQWLLNAALTANPIGLVIVAIAGLAAGLVIAYRRSETFRRTVSDAFDRVRAAAARIKEFFVGTLQPAILSTFNFFRDRVQVVIDKVRAIVDAIRDVIAEIKALPGKVLGPLERVRS